ncbi:MAG: response regulator [Bacteroidales bacterium]|nr:response regulator [Bacteroidales bacterium]
MDEMKKPIILIAEDEDSNYTVLKMLLEKKLSAEIFRARNGLEAVEITRTNERINLVLMDIKMPVMDGFEATGIIKTERKELPVIAITAYGLSGDEHKALSAGCDDYVSKPIQTNALFEKIKNILNIT